MINIRTLKEDLLCEVYRSRKYRNPSSWDEEYESRKAVNRENSFLYEPKYESLKDKKFPLFSKYDSHKIEKFILKSPLTIQDGSWLINPSVMIINKLFGKKTPEELQPEIKDIVINYTRHIKKGAKIRPSDIEKAQNAIANELKRIPLPRTPVSRKGLKKGKPVNVERLRRFATKLVYRAI